MGTTTLTAVKLQYPYQHGWVFVAQVALSGSSVSLLDSFRATRAFLFIKHGMHQDEVEPHDCNTRYSIKQILLP